MTSSDVLLYKTLLQTASSVPIPGSRELNDAFPHLRSLHRKKIKETLAMCYPEYAIIMDGTPIFAEADCVMIRVVHKETKKIHQLVVRLGLYAESLDGDTIAEHVVETLVGDVNVDNDKGLGLKLRNWRVSALDRASTNKK